MPLKKGKKVSPSPSLPVPSTGAPGAQGDAVTVSLNDELKAAACRFDAAECRAHIERGADVKHVFKTGANAWYGGDTTTCLYAAISAFSAQSAEKQQASQERYVEVVTLLLGAGADPAFSAQRGNWNRVSHSPLMEGATQTIRQLPDPDLKKQLLMAFAGAGVELNARTFRGKQGNCGGYGAQTYALFPVVRDLVPGSDLGLLAVYLDAGVEVNCSESSWSVVFDVDSDDEDGDGNEQSHETLLHAAIQTGNPDLVQLLVAFGADCNQNMVFKAGGRCYTQSCLQLAMEVGNADVVAVLREAGAREQICGAGEGLSDVVRMFKRGATLPTIRYHEGGQGVWAAERARVRARSDGDDEGEEE